MPQALSRSFIRSLTRKGRDGRTANTRYPPEEVRPGAWGLRPAACGLRLEAGLLSCPRPGCLSAVRCPLSNSRWDRIRGMQGEIPRKVQSRIERAKSSMDKLPIDTLAPWPHSRPLAANGERQLGWARRAVVGSAALGGLLFGTVSAASACVGCVGREQRSQQRWSRGKGRSGRRSSHLRLWVAAFMHQEPEHLQSAHYLSYLAAYLPTCLPACLPSCLLPTVPSLTFPHLILGTGHRAFAHLTLSPRCSLSLPPSLSPLSPPVHLVLAATATAATHAHHACHAFAVQSRRVSRPPLSVLPQCPQRGRRSLSLFRWIVWITSIIGTISTVLIILVALVGL